MCSIPKSALSTCPPGVSLSYCRHVSYVVDLRGVLARFCVHFFFNRAVGLLQKANIYGHRTQLVVQHNNNTIDMYSTIAYQCMYCFTLQWRGPTGHTCWAAAVLALRRSLTALLFFLGVTSTWEGGMTALTYSHLQSPARCPAVERLVLPSLYSYSLVMVRVVEPTLSVSCYY